MAEIYVPGAIDIMGSANQMMQFRNSQQAQQANALQMQYAAEDRARAAQERSAAAGNARAELARKQQFMDTIKGGYMPAKTAVMGPGTVQGNTPASFDPEKVKNELLRRGDLSGLVTFSNAQEQIAKQQEQEAKVTGQGLTNEGIRATNTGTNFKNTADFIKMTNAQIDAAPDIASLRAIVAATFTPDHPMAKFNELNGLTLEQSMAAIDGLIAQGKTFEQIREQMSQGASKAAENIAARGLVTAQTDKAKGEAGASKAGVFGDTNEGRQLQIVNEVLKGTRLPSDPEYALAYDALYAGKSMPAYNPDTKQMELVKAPATAPANLPPPTLGKASVAATPPLTMASVASNLRPPVQTNALSTMNGALRPPVQANALAALPDAPIITKAPTGGLTEAQKFKLKGDTSKDYAIATETLRSIQDVTRVVDKLEKADISGVTGYMSLAPSLTEESTIAESNIEGLKAKMTALAKVMSAATGKLGNLAIQEYQLLQNQIDTFDPYKGEVATRDQLSNIKNTMKRIEFVVRDVYSKEYGGEDNPFAQFRELPTNVGGDANAAAPIVINWK